MEIIMLGTGGSIPTKERGLPSIAVKYEGDVYLFDCGEGTQRQLMKYDIRYGRIKGIFLTHSHLDHVLGVYGLLETFRLNCRTEELFVAGPWVGRLFNGKNEKRYPFLKLCEVDRSGKVFETDRFTVRAFKTYHTTLSFGYLFEEKDTIRFKQPMCEELGIRGTMFKELETKGWVKIGRKKIKFSDVTYRVPGRRFAYLGDTLPNKSIEKAVRGVNVLIADSMFGSDMEGLAKERGHSTAAQAALMAKNARVGQLVLTHISQRYKDCSALLEEARKIFDNTICAEDGLVIPIRR